MTSATLRDVEGIYHLIQFWSAQGENLPREREDIINQLPSFKLIKNQGGDVVACGGLHIYDEHLVEIRSLGVLPDHHGKGLGKRLVYALLAAAKEMNLQTAFVLTRQPEFFSACDFEIVSIDTLPKKILKDCQFCPRKESCDEVAMIYEL
jgi:argininosuccinate lyase/amino-acid N-acetyltransferase